MRKAGRTAIVAGAKPVAFLPDRAERNSQERGVNLFAGMTLPPELRSTLTNRLGPFPAETNTSRTRIDWTVDALLETLWAGALPDFTFVWMNQPDFAQHFYGPGTEQALNAIRNSDNNLARILKGLAERGVLDQTDILITSDHGCSTLATKVDLAAELTKAGFDAKREFKAPPKKGEVLVVSNSGSTLVYVTGHEESEVRKIVEFLQGWNATGVIFTRKEMPGTFSLKQVHLNSKDAPDIVVSMRWTATTNKSGVVGLVDSDATSFNSGQGIHVSLSPFDMHATLVAAGPDFRSGITSTLPSGNVDVAPTVYHLLGIKPPTRLDGRVLSEALRSKGPAIKSFEPQRIEATARTVGGVWNQYLNFTEVSGVIYLDEGNGGQSSEHKP